MRLLFIGDVSGRPGRRLVKELVPRLREQLELEVVVANGENAAGGLGITPNTADELRAAGVDVLTLGNHTWDKREIYDYLDAPHHPIIRPLNFPPNNPGRGVYYLRLPKDRILAVMQLHGRVFFPVNLDCPFAAADEALQEIHEKTELILVDCHAEATSEKQALGWYLDGRVSAVVGTHTHVQTADEVVLPGGTAYITDAGMTGPTGGVLGVDKELVIEKFLSQMPPRFSLADGEAQLSGVVIDINTTT